MERALKAIDAVNAEDPNVEGGGADAVPKELLYGRRMSERLQEFFPEASDELRVACRAQHIARWRSPREDYPEGRKGYKRWRADLGRMHGELAEKIALEAGFDAERAARIAALTRKQSFAVDPEAQVVEDVACLVFLEHYFAPFAAKHDEDKLVDIVRKTWKKMSERGRQAALAMHLPSELAEIVKRALS